ncbi:MAG: C1 family peptidase [Nitrososphaera sp.]|jgi:C1A family cysteine protease
MSYKIQKYGWIPDLPDHRDFMYSAPPAVLQKLPDSVDLTQGSSFMPPVYDQGQVGSCTANAIAGGFQYARRKNNEAPDFVPSRLFIYYNERVIEGTVSQDSGAQIRDGIKTIAKSGVCPETPDWPYDPSKVTVKPSPTAFHDASKYKAVQYQRLNQDLAQLKGCLASGYPFVFGFMVYESFESQHVAQTGNVPMPAPSESAIGGHAVLAVGYDDKHRQFLVRNSWGSSWGKKGYCHMPYEYLINTNLASDFWTISLIKA